MPLTGARTAAIHIIDMDMLDDKIAINQIFLQSLREPPSAESDRCVFCIKTHFVRYHATYEKKAETFGRPI